MKNEQILKLAIEKAVKNGWELKGCNPNDPQMISAYVVGGGYYWVIFQHDFAKAFWGEKKVRWEIKYSKDDIIVRGKAIAWRYHLQQMVLEKDPIKYLAKFL